jgi:Fe-S cluster assembly iron-binding protein IscA
LKLTPAAETKLREMLKDSTGQRGLRIYLRGMG